VEIKKRTIEIKNGALEITFLQEGKLVLGQFKGERVFQYDLVRSLKENGIICGYLEQCLGLIEGGMAEQIPIAQAFIDDEPGTYVFLFEQNYTFDTFLEMVRQNSIPALNLLQPVKKNEVLVEVAEAPHTVLKFPDGTREILKELLATDIKYFSGANTSTNEQEQNIVSRIDGYAHRTPFGDVHVHPLLHVKSVGKAHGKLIYEQALEIENDIRSEADLSSRSNIHVNGMIRAAKVHADGNISCQYSFDNPKRVESAEAVAGQSIYAEAVRQYRLRAGIYVIIRNVIENSIVKCQNSVLASKIVASEIRVGRSLFAREITKDSKIYLGRPYINDPVEKEMLNYYHQHEKVLKEIESDILFIQEKLRLEQVNSIKQLNKLKRVAPESMTSDVLLKRYLKNQQNVFVELQRKINHYERQSNILTRERIRLSFFGRQYINENEPMLVVTERLEAGTQIYAAGQRLRLEKDYSNVILFVSPSNGKLSIRPIHPDENPN